MDIFLYLEDTTVTTTEKTTLVSDGVLSIAEAAKELRLHTKTITRLIQAGTLPYCKIGRRKLIPRKAIEAMLADAVVA